MKRLRVILLFLLLGAIINIALAWVIALTVTKENSLGGPSGTSFADDEIWRIVRSENFGTYYYHSCHDKEYNYNYEEEYLEFREYYSNHLIENVIPNWGSMDDTTSLYQTLPGPPEHLRVVECRLFQARGWPKRSLWCLAKHFVNYEVGGDYIHKTFEPRGLIATPILPHELWGPRVLPLYPIWNGFVLNTLFYATILWLLFPGPHALHRMIRHKRGLCVKCAYDLRGVEHEACPECGSGIVKANPA